MRLRILSRSMSKTVFFQDENWHQSLVRFTTTRPTHWLISGILIGSESFLRITRHLEMTLTSNVGLQVRLCSTSDWWTPSGRKLILKSSFSRRTKASFWKKFTTSTIKKYPAALAPWSARFYSRKKTANRTPTTKTASKTLLTCGI